jgi:cysteine sulfinate desulfinase/cysteine desulfurase-like protein
MYIKGIEAKQLLDLLPNICMSRGAVCKSTATGGHVPKALGLDDNICSQIIRIGFGSATDCKQVIEAAKIISAKANKLRGIEKRKDGGITPRPNSISKSISASATVSSKNLSA